MRVSKFIKGEQFFFYFNFIAREKKAKIRYFKADDWVICDLSEDFNYIILPSGKFVFNGVEVKKLKLNKGLRRDAIEYNQT